MKNSMKVQRIKQITALLVFFSLDLFLEKASYIQKITILHSSFLQLEAYFTMCFTSEILSSGT